VYGLKVRELLRRTPFGPQCGVINTLGLFNMAESTLWWLATGSAIAVELLTGTFYLLMLATGFAAAALAAHLGWAQTSQMVVAAAVGGGAVVAWHLRQSKRRHQEPPAQANTNVSLDIGEAVQIDSWYPDGTANVHYRGARWTAIHRPGVTPSPGLYRVAEMVGNRLLVDKA
jgi:membrane protein implicated in regulation of membrane protease activity